MRLGCIPELVYCARCTVALDFKPVKTPSEKTFRHGSMDRTLQKSLTSLGPLLLADKTTLISVRAVLLYLLLQYCNHPHHRINEFATHHGGPGPDAQ
jgi:hypothetical protein